MKKKLIVDILMFILMLLEFSRLFTGALLHELIGIGITNLSGSSFNFK